jgi:hypothetical protein
MILIMILCILGRTGIPSVVASLMVLMKATTALKVAVDILFIDIVNELDILFVKFLQKSRIF